MYKKAALNIINNKTLFMVLGLRLEHAGRLFDRMLCRASAS
jgi:hypothetical protein